MNTLSLHCLPRKLMSFGIFCAQALFDYSGKEHKGLVPQAAQISQKHICLKIRNDWTSFAGMMGRFIPQLTARQAGHGPTSSRGQAKGRGHILPDMRADSRGGYKPDSHESGHSFPSPAPGPPLCLSLGTGGSSAAPWVPQQGMLPRCLVQHALLEMVSAPKYYFCTVPQQFSSCLTLRLLFLLAVVISAWAV